MLVWDAKVPSSDRRIVKKSKNLNCIAIAFTNFLGSVAWPQMDYDLNLMPTQSTFKLCVNESILICLIFILLYALVSSWLRTVLMYDSDWLLLALTSQKI